MLTSTLVFELLSLAVLLIPALTRWLQGRRLVRRLSDPAFAELRLAAGHRMALVFGACLAVGLLLGSRFVPLKLLLATVALFAADHSSRRIIFGESRGVIAYLIHSMRLTIAMFGIWILLALTPILVLAAGSAGISAAILLAVSGMLWVHLGGHLFPALVAAKPLAAPELISEFDRILGLARCRRPVIFRAGAPGGYWVNAFAIPSLYRPGVLFTEDLLKATTPAESAAIFAHEVAHLEFFTRRRLLQRDLLVLLLSGLVSSSVLWFGPDAPFTRVMIWLWPLLCIVPFVAAQSRQQELEHQSDLRALELTGDVEALVSALTKIHHLLRLPRRWRGDLQAKQSHPSLAARIRAIREAAGTQSEEHAVPPLRELILHGAANGGEAVVLSSDRVHWLRGVGVDSEPEVKALLEGAGDRRSIRYEDLTDLRLEVRGESGRHLVAIDRDGTTLRLDLRPEDVAAVQDRLQRIDVRLPGTGREVTAAMQGQARRKWIGRIWGLLAALLGLLPPFSLPLLAAGALVVWRPARATLAAAAAIGIGLLLVGHPAQNFEIGPITLPVPAETVIGLVFLFELIARIRAKVEEPRSTGHRAVTVLLVVTVCYLAGGIWRLGSPLPWMQFHQWARFGYGLTLTLIGVAAATLTLRPRSRRLLALAPATLAALLLLAGTLWFRDHFGDDPLGERTASLAVEDVQLERVRERSVEGYVSEVRISPTGKRLATRSVREAQGFEIEPWGEQEAVFVEAVDLVWLGDERVARLVDRGESLALQTLLPGVSAEVLSEWALPSLTMPKLVVDGASRSWQVVGSDVYRSVGTRLSGSFASPGYQKAQWKIGDNADSYLTAMSMNAAPAAVAVLGRIDFDGPAMLASWLGIFGGYVPLSELSLVEEAGQTTLAVTAMNVRCLHSSIGQTRFLCSTYDPEGVSRLWSVDTEARRLEPIGTLPGIYHAAVPVAPGHVVFVGFQDDPLWYDDGSRQVRRLRTGEPEPLESRSESVAETLPRWFLQYSPEAFAYGARYQAADVRGRFLALVAYQDGVSRVTVHRVPGRLDGSDPSRQARLGGSG